MLARTIDGWREACDEVAAKMLAEAGLEDAPVDMFALAEALDFDIVIDRTMLGRTRFKQLGGRATIFLKPDKVSERQQWALAHELGERSVERVLLELGTQEKVGGRLREQIATEVASRLLLPGRAFLEAVEETDGDLDALKARFESASYDLILLSLLRWPEESVVTLLEESSAVRRFGNRGPAPKMAAVEHELTGDLLREGGRVDRVEDGIRLQGWTVGGPEGVRVMLRTTKAPKVPRQLEFADLMAA